MPDSGTRVTSGAVIDRLRAAGRKALVIYLPVGFPDVSTSIMAAQVAVEAGADIVELGLPYSDPVMDGDVIARAAAASLAAGTHIADVFTAVRETSQTGAATLVMTYFNPVFRYGTARFAENLDLAGGAGLITPDLTPDVADEWITVADRHDLDKVFLVALSSTPARLQLTADASRGFVYAASIMGVTGTRASVGEHARELVERTRAAGAKNVCVGLGVSTPEQAAEVARFADGVIIGSAVVKELAKPDGLTRVRDLVGRLRSAIDQGATV